MVMPAAGLLGWAIASACFGTLVPLLPIIVQIVITVLVFPVFAVFFRPLGVLATPRPG